MARRNQAHDDLVDSTPKASLQQSKITQSMIGNFWEYCKDYNAGPASSKEQKNLSWCILTMLTCDTTENHAKLDHEWLDISLNSPNTICVTLLGLIFLSSDCPPPFLLRHSHYLIIALTTLCLPLSGLFIKPRTAVVRFHYLYFILGSVS